MPSTPWQLTGLGAMVHGSVTAPAEPCIKLTAVIRSARCLYKPSSKRCFNK